MRKINNTCTFLKLIDLRVLAVAILLLSTFNSYSQNSPAWPSSGSVGIGTSSPLKLLHISSATTPYTPTLNIFGGYGSVINQGAEPGYTLSQDINSSGVPSGSETALGGMAFSYISSADYNNLRIGTQSNHHVIFRTANTDRMIVNNTGNVGIGVTTPGDMLDVNGGIRSRTGAFTLHNGATAVGGLYTHKTATGAGSDLSSTLLSETDMYFMTAGAATPKAVILANGNVGIGVSSPAEVLDVNGGIRSRNGAISIRDGNIAAGGLYTHKTVTGTGSNISPTLFSETDMYFMSGGVVTPKAVILGNGNMGIGTAMPTEKLSVNGKIRSQEIKVETINWPDDVFAPSYRLPSLNETEKFIKENKHLPGIPSAKEAETDGINLGEMNGKLLQKIEELTLYIIDQDKQSKAQQETIDKLGKLIKAISDKLAVQAEFKK